MAADLFQAFALVLIVEGLMPFLAPSRWRETMLRLTEIEPGTLRLFGGVLIGLGALLLQFVH